MKNIKFIIGFSVFGFLLSFIAGFASNSTFLKMLLNALIFAFVFAGVCALVSFLWKSFLSSDFEQAGYSSNKQPTGTKKTGQTVDITIQDESLQTDDNASQFFVGSNHQMLTNDDIGEKNQDINDSNDVQTNTVVTSSSTNGVVVDKKAEKAESAIMDDKGFVPVTLSETASNISSTEAKPGSEYLNQKNNNNDENSSAELDVLPDLQELQNIQEMTASKDVPEPSPVVNSSFIPEDVRRTVSEANTESKDAALMAKAISTLLSKE